MSTAHEVHGLQVELWAKIKKSSKYYHQGVDQETNKPVFLPVSGLGVPTYDEYIVRLPGNRYRIKDLQLFIRLPDGRMHPL